MPQHNRREWLRTPVRASAARCGSIVYRVNRLRAMEGTIRVNLYNPRWVVSCWCVPMVDLHHAPRVRRVIQLFKNGGASPMDTFDYKPALEKYHGQSLARRKNQRAFTAPAVL